MSYRDQMLRLSEAAAEDASWCSQRGDTEGDFYARGLRDAYATAAAFAPRDMEQAGDPHAAERWQAKRNAADYGVP
jgi:hypothetical protein